VQQEPVQNLPHGAGTLRHNQDPRLGDMQMTRGAGQELGWPGWEGFGIETFFFPFYHGKFPNMVQKWWETHVILLPVI
jgi:hypothetical protein